VNANPSLLSRAVRSIRGRVRRWRAGQAQRRLLREPAPREITRANWAASLRDPDAFYRQCFLYFHQCLPEELRAHREYFTRHGRGFGEDAFHAMWFLIFREFQPRVFLEIGVFRGQTLSLAALLQRRFGGPGQTVGISPFTPAGDQVSRYQTGVDYYQDTLDNFANFGLPRPELFRAFSTDAPARELIASRTWDCIYIDGNHDDEVVLADWDICSRHVKPGGLVVLDDAGLTSAFHPPEFATGGHPGPSRLAAEIDRAQFVEILQVGHNRVFQKVAG
jgi:Methyltransferase domain